jgi:RHS repeat-associated protein
LAKRTAINQEINIYYYHTDHLGSTRSVTDGSSKTVSSVTYHPFGEPCTEEGSEDHLFNMKERDATGLYNYGTRYYDAELGRFITRDIRTGRIEIPQSLNRFTYCYNNPVCYVDPDGRTPKKHAIDGSSAPSQNYMKKKHKRKLGVFQFIRNKGRQSRGEATTILPMLFYICSGC